MTNQKSLVEVNTFKQLLSKASSVAVIPSKVGGLDSFTAAVGLFYMLRDKHEGKNVHFVYQGKMPEKGKELISDKDVTSNIMQRELVISVDYAGTDAANAQYDTKDDVLEIKLSPVSKDFDKSRVSAEIKGSDFDLIVLVGVQKLSDLGNSLSKIKEEFEDCKVVNIDNTSLNTNFGDVNEIDTTCINLSTLVFNLASKLNLNPKDKAARALLTGMTYKIGLEG